MFFKCKHPANSLCVEKEATVSNTDDPLYQHVTYHLFCLKCDEKVEIKFARLTCSVEEAFEYHKQLINNTNMNLSS